MIGKIIKNVSSKYEIVTENGEKYNATSRGKLKQGEIIPAVGDNVEFEIIDKSLAVINDILPRSSYMKRPKVANISQIIFVISCEDPKPNLLMLDKELVYAEFLNIKPVIVINKTDLNKEEEKKIKDIYTKTRI